MCPNEKAVWKNTGKRRAKACCNALNEQGKFWMEEKKSKYFALYCKLFLSHPPQPLPIKNSKKQDILSLSYTQDDERQLFLCHSGSWRWGQEAVSQSHSLCRVISYPRMFPQHLH